MKARVKATGEIVNVRYDVHPNPDVKPCWYVVNDKGDIVDFYHDAEIELIDITAKPIDWEQRRYEIAKDVLVSSFSTPMEGTSVLSYVRSCVQIADILIAELKGDK